MKLFVWTVAAIGLWTGCAATRNTVYTERPISLDAFDCVAVVPFENLSRSAGAGYAVADAVAEALYASGRIHVVERAEVLRQWEKMARGELTQVDPGLATEIGRALRADAVIVGSVNDYWYRSVDARPEVSVTARLVEVNSGRVVYVASGSYAPKPLRSGPTLLTAAAGHVAQAIIAPLTTQPPSRGPAASACGVAPSANPSVATVAKRRLEPTGVETPAATANSPVTTTPTHSPPSQLPNEIAGPDEPAKPVVAAVASPKPPQVALTPAALALINKMSSAKNFVLNDIEFELDKTTLRGDRYRQALENLAVALQSRPNLRIRIDAHTDGLGDPVANKKLTELRAELLKDYLVRDYGIEASRIETAGFGGEKPLLPNINRKNRETNRRVEITVLQGP